MKKIVWIDLGTHFAQEHSSIFGSNIIFYSFLFKRFVGGALLRRGKFVSLKGLKNIIQGRSIIKKRGNEFYSIFVEANPKIAKKMNFYPDADLFFNLALTNNFHDPLTITKLYLGDGADFSQGSSIFLEKHNVSKDSFIATLGISVTYFFKEIKSYLNENFNDYVVLLRLNCEGIEDDAIYAAHESFGNKLKLICGSLKDVEGVKGQAASQKLDKFLSDNQLYFAKFYAPIYTWPEGHAAVIKLLEEIDQSTIDS